MPAGSNARFSSRCSARSAGGSGANAPAALSRAAEQRRMAARARAAAARTGAASRVRLAASAAPRPIRSAARRADRAAASCDGSDSRHSGASPREERIGRARGCPVQKRAACAAATRSPPSFCAAARTALARARQAQRQLAVAPGAGRDRQRLAGPAVERSRAPCACGISKRSVSFAAGSGSTLSETSRIRPSVPSEPGQQARHVVAGDVLHHLAAEARARCRAPSMMRAPSTKSRTAPALARRGPDRPAATQPPRVAPAPKCGGSKASIWPCSRQHRLELGERRAAARRDHQLGRLVVDDAGVAARVEQSRRAARCRRNPCCRRRGCAAALPRRARRRGCAPGRSSSIRSAAARGAAAARRARACAPNSAQRCSVGHGLAGIEQARADRRRASPRGTAPSSAAPNCTHIWLIFSTPTPCSPVMVPPTSTHFSSISAANASVRCSWSGVVGVEQDQRMQVAVAGVEHVRRSAGRTSSPSRAMKLQHLAQALARDGAVHAVVVGRDAARPRETPPCARTRSAAARPRRATPRGASRRARASTSFMRAISSSTSSARAVGFAQQDRRGLEVVAGVHELLDRARWPAGPSSPGRRG